MILETFHIALVGSPNSSKALLFNALTGSRRRSLITLAWWSNAIPTNVVTLAGHRVLQANQQPDLW